MNASTEAGATHGNPEGTGATRVGRASPPALAETAWSRIRSRQEELGTSLCVGLDPVPERLPAGCNLVEFCLRSMEATAPYVCAFKPNAAFFEAEGIPGWTALLKVIRFGQELGVPVILDAKRGDIGSTAARYAKAALGTLGADGVTVSPYLGREAIIPFLEYNETSLIFVLCVTSNPFAEEVQAGLSPAFLRVARIVKELSRAHPHIGLVVGATRPETMHAIREAAPGLPWLVPGIGAQGADLAAVVAAAEPHAILSASRHVIYAGEGARFDIAARDAARELRDAYNTLRGKP